MGLPCARSLILRTDCYELSRYRKGGAVKCSDDYAVVDYADAYDLAIRPNADHSRLQSIWKRDFADLSILVNKAKFRRIARAVRDFAVKAANLYIISDENRNGCS